jgi:hypothetical protein
MFRKDLQCEQETVTAEEGCGYIRTIYVFRILVCCMSFEQKEKKES